MSKTLTIVIPCYNESASLPIVLPDLIAFVNSHDYRLIITNDGSKDSSLEILNQYLTAEPRCKVVSHKVNRGYGGAIKSGIAVAETDYVITIDADGQHYFDDINKLFQLALAKDADMVIGSRKGEEEASAIRGIGKSIVRSIAKILMPITIYDINSGMKLYSTPLAKKYLNICPDSMAYSDIIALTFISQRHLVLEESIKIRKRVAGESTINIRTAYETIMEIINIVVLFNPMRIFLPLAILFFVFGVIWNIQFVFFGKGVSIGGSLLVISGLIFFMLGLVTEQLSNIRKSLIKE